MTENTDSKSQVPEGVLRGIEDIADGRTASKADIESVLRFESEKSNGEQ